MLLVARTVTGQQVSFNAEAESLFDNGLEEFNDGRYAAAAVTFTTLVSRYPASHRTTAAYLMAGESYFKESKYDSTVRILRPMFLLYPESSLLPRATIVMAEAYSRSGDGFNALLSAFVALQTANNIDTAIVMRPARKIIARWGTPKTFDSLLVIFDEKELRDIVGSYAAMKRNGQPDEGVQKKKAESAKLTYRIGVVMRRFDIEPGKTLVRELSRGIQKAMEDRRSRVRVRLDIDSQYYHKESELNDILRRWKSDNHTIACIGGVFTEDAKALLKIFKGATFPILVPLANGAGLEAQGAVFLLNSSLQERARAVALFCATTLHAKRAAVLAPLSDLGKQMANAFLDEAKRRGMLVRGVSWYKPSTMNFIPYFNSLKNALESENNLDVLYLPFGGLRSRSRRIISALNQVDLHTCLIGSDEWQYSLTDWSVLLEGTRMYCTASMFPSSERRSNEEMMFNASEDGTSEGYIMGYNAMCLILRALEDGAGTHDEITKRLEEMGLITGFKTAISLSSRGQNQAVLILRFNGQEFKLEKIIDRVQETK